MNRTVLIAVALALVLPSTALAKKGGGNSERLIKVSKGTKQLGGTATLDITSLSGNTSWVLNINPSGGYFVSKGVEVLGGVNLDLTDGSSSWGVEGGLRYFFDMNPMWAYAGGEGGYGSTDLAGTSYTTAEVAGHGGVLIPLAKNVGLDLGGQVGMVFPESGDSWLTLSAGYLGVQAFFK